jgi:type IV fimbrial biogenesis protein FimT
MSLLYTCLSKRKQSTSPLNSSGVTLIEVMSTVSIISILAALILPNMDDFIVRIRVDSEISTINRLLLITRNAAINSQSNAVLCPLNENGQCSTEWHNKLSVFVDSNNNRKFDAHNNETILQDKAAIKANDTLIYGKMRKSIIFHPAGHLSGLSNGTFRYCPFNHEDKSRGIVIARSGRVYVTNDIDNDMKDETRMNKEITCD